MEENLTVQANPGNEGELETTVVSGSGLAEDSRDEGGQEFPPDMPTSPNCNLIVNYLPHNIDDMMLRGLFLECGEIITTKVVTDRHTKKSLGYGFVKFIREDDARQAISKFNGFIIDQKCLKVSIARPPSLEIRNCKLYITNLPPHFTEADVIELFKEFGEIIECRVLKDKVNRASKGVAFVQFDNRMQANDALTLNGCQLEGSSRGLVVKYAEDQHKRREMSRLQNFTSQSLYRYGHPGEGDMGMGVVYGDGNRDGRHQHHQHPHSYLQQQPPPPLQQQHHHHQYQRPYPTMAMDEKMVGSGHHRGAAAGGAASGAPLGIMPVAAAMGQPASSYPLTSASYYYPSSPPPPPPPPLTHRPQHQHQQVQSQQPHRGHGYAGYGQHQQHQQVSPMAPPSPYAHHHHHNAAAASPPTMYAQQQTHRPGVGYSLDPAMSGGGGRGGRGKSAAGGGGVEGLTVHNPYQNPWLWQ